MIEQIFRLRDFLLLRILRRAMSDGYTEDEIVGLWIDVLNMLQDKMMGVSPFLLPDHKKLVQMSKLSSYFLRSLSSSLFLLSSRGVAKRESELHKQTSLALPTNSHHEISTDIAEIHSNEHPNAYPMFKFESDLYFFYHCKML